MCVFVCVCVGVGKSRTTNVTRGETKIREEVAVCVPQRTLTSGRVRRTRGWEAPRVECVSSSGVEVVNVELKVSLFREGART